jgi:hypothetical protein
VPVQELYSAAAVILQLLERDGAVTGGAVVDLHAALATMGPHIEAHFSNQDHATSPDLAAARQPAAPTVLVLDRVLPFPTPAERER